RRTRTVGTPPPAPSSRHLISDSHLHLFCPLKFPAETTETLTTEARRTISVFEESRRAATEGGSRQASEADLLGHREPYNLRARGPVVTRTPIDFSVS